MSRKYKIVDEDGIYFITSSIIEFIPIFTYEKYFQILTASMNFCSEQKDLEIFYYVVMDNHFHMIVKAEKIANVIQSLKSYTSSKVIELLKENNQTWKLELFKHYNKHKEKSIFQIWQEGYHPKLISSLKILNQKIEYIHNNPIKRGFVSSPEAWKYSSANNKSWNGEDIVRLSEIDF